MIRKSKKTRKKRGYEMHSGLRRRGAGNRGGRGNAGKGKKSGGQKKTKMLAMGKRLGKYGFKNKSSKKLKSINLNDLMKHVKNKSVDAKALGYDRVLGRGKPIQGVTVKAKYFTKSAKNKIEKVKGKAIVN